MAGHSGFRKLAVAVAATMVRQIVGAGVLSSDQLMLATATDQRIARVDKERLARTQKVNTKNLKTPSLQGEAKATNKATKDQRKGGLGQPMPLRLTST